MSIALKVAGFLTRDVGLDELSETLSAVLPAELTARRVADAEEVCAAIDSLLHADDARR